MVLRIFPSFLSSKVICKNVYLTKKHAHFIVDLPRKGRNLTKLENRVWLDLEHLEPFVRPYCEAVLQ